MKPTKHAMMKEDCGATLINEGTLCRTAEAAVAEKNEEPEVVISSSSPYDENTDDEDFASSSRRNDVACSRRRDGQSKISTAIPEKVTRSSVYEEDTDDEEMIMSPEKEDEETTSTRQLFTATRNDNSVGAADRNRAPTKIAEREATTNGKMKPSRDGDQSKVDWKLAVCVAKLYDIAPELVQERGFIEALHDLIFDLNPSVVANGVAAVSESSKTSGGDVMKISASVLQKLLVALNECTEWGQVFILDSLAKYVPGDAREAESIIERVTPRLQHTNSAVVMSAVKVILSYMDVMATGGANQESIRALTRKLAPPLIRLLNSEKRAKWKQHREYRKTCIAEGCTNQVIIGGVCKRHGAIVKRCSNEGCTNKASAAQRKQSSKRKRLSSTEDVKVARKRATRLKYRYECSADGCTNQVQKGGVCIKHGAKVKRCSSEGCKNHAKKGGVCVKHGAKVKLCNIEGCTNKAIKRGVC
jgi:hypothetical protein